MNNPDTQQHPIPPSSCSCQVALVAHTSRHTFYASQDMKLVIISFIVFILVAVALLSKADTVLTRTSLALLGVLVTALGLMSGWGWGMIFGMPFTPLQRECGIVDVRDGESNGCCQTRSAVGGLIMKNFDDPKFSPVIQSQSSHPSSFLAWVLM